MRCRRTKQEPGIAADAQASHASMAVGLEVVAMNKETGRIGCALIFVALLLIVLGCSKLTPEAYDQLRVGMSFEEVVKILGQPDACEGALGFKECTWGNATRHINVKFGGESVVFYSAKGL